MPKVVGTEINIDVWILVLVLRHEFYAVDLNEYT